MLLTCGLTVEVMMSVADYSIENHPGFYLSNHSPVSIDYIPTYDSVPLSVQSIRQIKSLDNVRSVCVGRKLPILLDLPNVPRYVYAEDEMNQYGMLDDRAFEEAMSMTMNLPDLSYYSEKRDADRTKYLELCKDYGFDRNAFLTFSLSLGNIISRKLLLKFSSISSAVYPVISEKPSLMYFTVRASSLPQHITPPGMLAVMSERRSVSLTISIKLLETIR